MPDFNTKLLGDWILIAASVAAIAGIGLLVVIAAYTQLIDSEQSDQAFNAAVDARRVRLGENPAEVTKERQSELRYFVEKNCPACHGPRMTGSIGPPLSKADLQHLSIGALAFTILYGRPEKGMPPWEVQLSEKDAYWIAEFLKGDGVVK